MYKYHCLNPISHVGLERLDENYVKTEDAGDADKETEQEPGISEEGEEIKKPSVVNDFAEKMLRDESLRKRRRSSHGCYCLFHSLLQLRRPGYNGRE